MLTHQADDFGFKFDDLTFDWSKIIGSAARSLTKSPVELNCSSRKNKIDYIRGEAAIPKAGVVK